MFDKLEAVEARYEELTKLISDPEIIANQAEWQKLIKEHSSIEEVVQKYREYKKEKQRMDEAKEMMEDKELKELAEADYYEAKEKLPHIEDELKALLIPKDPNDDKNIICEIRGGAGGQHINKTSSAVRLIHEPSGIVVECQTERSQLQNREYAMKMLRSRLYNIEKEKQDSEIANARKSQVGSGDRSEKIRTYNYPQGRITDHRIGMSIFQMENFLNGDLDEMIDNLIAADRADKLQGEEE